MIASDDRGARAGQRGRQHDVVITVATNRRLECVGLYDRKRLLEQPKGRSHIDSALTEFVSQDTAKFVQQWLRGNHDVVADAVLQEIAADAARQKSGDEHVRIQQEFHETRVNTSSSVKMP